MSSGSNSLFGEAASLGAAMIWACSMSMYSRFGRRVPAAGLNLYKNFVALTCLTLTACIVGFHWPDSWLRVLSLALSGLLGLALGDTLLFHGIKTIGVQRTSVIQCLAPPLAAMIAWLMFDETLNHWEWIGLLTTTGALAWLIATKNSGHAGQAELNWSGLGAAFTAAVCQAFTVIILRQALQGVDVISGTLLRVVPAIACLTILNTLRGGWGPLGQIYKPVRNGLILTLAAFMGTFLGLLLMSTGAKYAKAGVTAAISSTYPVWIMPIAHFLLGERVSRKSVLLTILAVAGLAIMMIGE